MTGRRPSYGLRKTRLLHKNTGVKEYPLFQEIAQGFFDIGGPYFQKKERKDKRYLPSFYRQKVGYLHNYIPPYFKQFKINEINTYMCEEFSFSLEGLAGDTKNKILNALKEILKPWLSKGVLPYNRRTTRSRFTLRRKSAVPSAAYRGNADD
ncbi:MAG: phage integrase SAM-like domain-containing protein [Treponema sp.]|jgi:hypothetical protein|nr:phage integrase SAM-like domain-containing protein [Treponema sp.]